MRRPRVARSASTVRLAAAESLEFRLAMASDLDPLAPVIDVTASTIDAEPAIVSVTSTAPAAAVEVVAPVTSTSPETLAAKLVFVDRSVPDLDSILASAAEIGAETFLLDAAHDGLGQMVSALAGRSGINAIHIFSHGGPGRITLGSTNLTEAELAARAEDLAAIGAALAPDGDILLYGCGVADGFAGQDFVTALAAATAADVAASDDATGAVLFGGDWTLETTTGPVETSAIQANLGGNTLSNYVITVGRNAPRLYWQGRAEQRYPSGPFTNYAEPYTGDKITAHYVPTWVERTYTWDEPVAFNFFGIPTRWATRTGTSRTRELRYTQFNNGSGTRYGTAQFTLSAPSTYQFDTTASNLSAVIRGEEQSWWGGYSNYTVSLYRGSFDPARPLENLVAGNRGFTFQGTGYGFTTALPAGTYVAVTSFNTVCQFRNDDGFGAQWNHNAEWMLGTFTVNVTNLNRAPVWGTVANPTATGSGTKSFSVPWSAVSDPDGDAITVSASLVTGGSAAALPSWLSFNADSLTFTGNPPANTGTLTIRLTADDGQTTGTKDFTVTFTNDNDAPTVVAAIPDQTWSGSGSLSYQFPAGTFTDSDPSGTSFTYSATLADGSPLPAWLAFFQATRTFSGNPPANATDLSLRVTANDGSGQANATVSTDFTLKLRNNNDVPVALGFTKSLVEDGTSVFTANDFAYSDSDSHAVGGVATTGTGKTLQSVRILSLPANGALWLDADTDGRQTSGELVAVNQEIPEGDLAKLRFTPATNWVGSASFTWNATDGLAYATLPATATITVTLVNDAPVIALSGGRALSLRPNTGNQLSAITVDPGLTLTDPDTPYTSDAANYDTILGATVTVVDSVTGNFQAGDVLAATGISGRIGVAYNAGSGALTLSGSATAAEYQQVLRTLAFSSSNTTNDNLRTLSISLRTKDVTIPTVANFDGVDDYIETMRAAIPMAGDWTVSVWFRADSAMLGNSGRDYTILAQGTSSDNFYISKSGSTNNLRLGDAWTVTGGMPTDGGWHQITVVKSGTSSTNGTLYIDGVKTSTGQLSNAVPGTGMRIGRVYKRDDTQEWGSTYWQGSISDLRVYNRALNGLEVTNSVNSNTPLTGYEANLVSWYPLDGTADNKAAGSWNLSRDFDPRSPVWQQGPWDLGFIDTGSSLSDFPSSPTGNIFRSIDTTTSDPVISGGTRITVQSSSDTNRGKFVFVRNTVESAVSSTDTIRPGEVFTLAGSYSTAAQFTAPLGGIYGVDARFWKVFTNGGGDPKYRIYRLSGSTLSAIDGGGVINGSSPASATTSSLKQIVLEQGDKLIFGVTSNGSVDADEATLSLQVDLLATKVTSGSSASYYSLSNGHYYGISSGTATWDSAKTAAEALTVAGQSGYLATPTDSASMQIVRALLASAGTNGAWAGARQINSLNEPTGNFFWATGPKAGQPFNGAWNSGEPNNFGGNEHHVEITQANYNDNSGGTSFRYLLEFGDSSLPLPAELTGSLSTSRDPGNAMLFKDSNVAYSARTGHYYRVDSTARNWNAAATAAATTSYASQTGYLARITNLNELRIAGWFNRLRNQADQWVGLRQTDKTVEPGGGWQWVTGDEAGMTSDVAFATPTFWNAGEPNNAWFGTEDYAGMNNYGAGLNDFREVETFGSLIEYGIDGQVLAIPLFGPAPNQTSSIKFVSSVALVAVRVGNTGPSAANSSTSTGEDTALAFTAAHFTASFSDPELDSLASITITALPSAAAGVLTFKGTAATVNQVVLAGELNQLAFTPIANFNGSTSLGYTASDGYLSSSAATLTIAVNAANDPPVLDTAGSPALTAIAEDVADGSNGGTTVAAIVVAGSITDVDVVSPATVPAAIAVTGVDNTNGVWQYKVGSGNWTAFSATRDVVALGGAAVLLDATDRVRFVPDTNSNGSASFTYRAWDKSAGMAGGTSNPFALGGNTALSTAEETAAVTVTPVNDAPTTAGKTIRFDEDTTYVFALADFAFTDVDAGNSLQSVTITSLPASGTVTLNNGTADVAVSQNDVILLADIVAGRLKYTPPANAFGTAYASLGFTVSDGSASSTAATITFDVIDTNDAPTAIAWATGGSVAENASAGTVVGTLSATDPNTGDVLRFRRTTNANFTITPDGTVKVATNAVLDYEAGTTQTLGVEVSDSGGLTYVQNLTVTLTDVTETDPSIYANAGYVAPGATITITTSLLRAADAQQTPSQLVFTVQSLPSGGTFWIDSDGDGTLNGAERPLGFRSDSDPDAVNTFTQADIVAGRLKFTKDTAQSSGQLQVKVSDGTGGATPEARLILIPSNPPVVSPVDDQQWRTSGSQSFRLPAGTFTDPDQDLLTVSATLTSGQPLPGWLSFDPATLTFTGSPVGQADGSTLAIRVSATDGRTTPVSDDFTITFSATVTAPGVTNPIANQVFDGAGTKTFTVPVNTFTDPNAAALSYTATLAGGGALPSWLSFDGTTRVFSGNPPASAVPGPLMLKVTATSSGGSASSVFRLDILNANDAPAESPAGAIADQTLSGGGSIVFTVNRSAFADADGGTLSLAAALPGGGDLPSWLIFSFDPATGLGRFNADLPSGSGSLVVRVTADDGVGGAGFADFTISYSGGQNASPQVRTSAGTLAMAYSADTSAWVLSTGPFGQLAAFIVGQGATKAITGEHLLEADPDDDGADVTFTITTAPTRGQLWLDTDSSGTINGSESTLGVNGTFTQADIDAGRLQYRHTAGDDTDDSFVFNVADGGENGSQTVTGVTFPIGVAAVPAGGAPVLQTVARSLPGGAVTNADSVVFRVVFSENVSGVDVSDFVLTGAAAGSATLLGVQAINGTTRDVTVGGAGLANANGLLGLGLAASPSITDAGGLAIDTSVAASSTASYTIDNTAPTATATASAGGHDGATPFTVTFAFSEAVNGLTAAAFSATNATLSNFQQLSDGTNATNDYRVTVTPTAFAAITVSLAAGAATDAAGNANTAASLTVQAGATITGPGSATGTTSSTSVAENTTAVFTFTADLAVTWSLAGGADAARFTIDQTTGELRFAAAPNFESPADANADNAYVVIVRATDGSNIATDQTVTVTVTNANEAPTGVSLTNTTTSILENTSTTTRIKVADIAVTDDALGSKTITLTGTDAASFEVDGLALYLKSGVGLDFETKASYAVTVNVEDTALSGSTPVTVPFTLTITDVNEAPTGVSLTNTTTSILENTSTTTRIKVADIVVTDDALGSETITLTGTDAASFEVDGLALYLKSGVTLDRETKASFAVTVNVEDTSLTGSTPVTVGFTLTVTDVNEAPTGVSLTNTTTSIAENTSTTTRIKVADIVVTDDALGSETITLTGTDAASFEVDGLALYLKSGVTLDLETQASYAVTVNVEDTALNGSTPVTVGFTLTVTDVNDSPTITVAAGDSAAASLTETNASLTAAGTLSVADQDLANTVTVTVPGVVASGVTAGLAATNADLLAMFSVNDPNTVISSTATTGTITWAFDSGSETFDYLAAGETLTLTYTVRVTDSASVTADRSVTITVIGTNDAPVISLKREIQETTNLGLTTDLRTYSFYSPEGGDAEYGVVVNSPNTGFPDAASMAAAFQAHPDYGTLPYTITVNGAGTQLVLTFKTDGDFGQRMLQRWGDNGVPLTVVQDGGADTVTLAETNASLTAAGTLAVEDLDRTNTVTVTVPAVVASGTTTGLAANNAALLAMFSVNDPNTVISSTATTGTITWAFDSGSETFDYLAAGETLTLTYTVRVTDSASVTADQSVTITITGTNDAPTDIALSAAVVAENAASGTAVGSFSTSDVDIGDTFTYSLVSGTGDTDNASFQIVGGQLRTNASFDFETKSSYSIRVRSTDQSNAAFEKQFTITVTDANDAPTAVSLTNTTTSIAENTSTTTRIKVADIVVTDDALGSETITLTGADAASFEVDGLALYLKSGVALNFEAKASYAVTVNVEDTSLSGSTPVTVGFTLTVTDVNEAPTGVSLTNTTSSIAENTSTTTRIKVADIVVTDDALGSETITLTGADAASFEVDGLALYLKSGVSLDFETKASYAVTVNVEDTSLSGSTPVTAPFTLTVTDVNEAPTNILLSAASVAENSTSGTAVGSFSTTDVDTGDTFTYTLVSGSGDTDNAAFQIVGGQLRTNAAFDFETKNSYSIRVRSVDQGGLSFEKPFTISVTNVNDAPVILTAATALNPTHTSYRGGASTIFGGSPAFSLVEANDLVRGMVVTVTNVADGADEILAISGTDVPLVAGTVAISGGSAVVSVASGTATVTLAFPSGITPAATVSLLMGLTYRSATPASTVGQRVVTLSSLSDNGGGTDTLTGTLAASTVTVARETVAPTVSAVSVPQAGFYRAGQVLAFTVTMSESVIVTGAPTIGLTIGSTVRQLAYVPGDSDPNATPATLVFTYVLVSGDVDNDGVSLGSQIDLNGGSITDLAGNAGVLALNGVPSTAGVKVNLPPVGSDDTGTAVEAGGVANATGGSNATGNLLTNDTDNENDPLAVTAIRLGATEGAGTAGTLGQPLVGSYGSLTVLANGSFTYRIDETNAAVEALRPGDTLTESFNYTLTDGSSLDTAVLVITIHGTNDTPTVVPVQRSYTDTIVADTFADATGTLGGGDVDAAATRTWGIQGVQPTLGIATRQGLYGTLFVNVATGAYVYRPDAQRMNAIIANTSDVFTITADDATAVGSATFTVAITAAVDTPAVYRVSEDSGASVTDRITRNPVITVAGVADPGSTVKLLAAAGGTGSPVVVGTATASPSGAFSVTGSPLAEGMHRLTIVGESGSLASAAVLLGDWTIDLSTPTVPAITTSGTTGGRITGTAEPGSTVRVTFAAAAGYAGSSYLTTADGSGNWSIDVVSDPPVTGPAVPLPGGPFATTATAIDVAGNASAVSAPRSIAFDASAPQITSPSVTADLRPLIQGTAPASRSVRIYVDGVLLGTTTASAAGTWSFTPPADLAAGSRDVRAVAVIGSVEGASDRQALQIVRSAPLMPAFTTPALVATSTPSLTGTGPAAAMLTLSIRRAGQTPVTVYRTTVNADGTWRVDLGRSTPASGILETLADGEYDLEATATGPTGYTSAAATLRLKVDTTAPARPVVSSPATSASGTPVVSGTAEAGSTVRLVIGAAVFETIADGNGNWSVDLATATALTGTGITLPASVHEIRVTATDPSGNVSPEAVQLLRVTVNTGNEPPAVLALAASFGSVLSAGEVSSPATVIVAFAGIENGRIATLTLAGTGYQAVVTDGAASFTVPAAALAGLPQGSGRFDVAVSNLAGTAAPPFATSFSVDTVAPTRPTFGSITSTPQDPTPGDRFTGLVQPTVVINGEPGLTPVIRGPGGIIDPSQYAVTESPAGRYTIAFLEPQVRGDYVVNLQDANGNESGTGTGAQNAFRIDSVPVLYDQPAKRQTIASRVYGNLGVINYLAGDAFPVAPQADGTWIDLDGERVTMGIVGGAEQTSGGRVVGMTATVNGASLAVTTATGGYTYTPVAGTTRIDSFTLFLRDESGNQTQLVLSFDTRDYLDRDGVPQATESRLGGATGDRNADGTADSQQNSVTTLAWGTQANFATGINPATINRVDPRTVSTMVVNSRPLQGPGGMNFSSLSDLMRNVDPLAQLLEISVVSPAALSATSPVSGGFSTVRWDAMKYSVESLVSWGLVDLLPGRAGTQIQVSFDVSAAGMLTRGGTSGAAAFTAARKFVSADTISGYAAAGLPLRDLDGNAITRPDWYDFAARDLNNDGIYDTDGVIYVDFQRPGQAGYGIVDAAVVVLTDNAFGDDDPRVDRVVDPFLPGTGNAAPTLAAVDVGYVNTPVTDVFGVSTGTLAAGDGDGDRLTYGIVGGTVRRTTATATNQFGTLQVDTGTGRWVFTPSNPALNAVSSPTVAGFTTTVTDGKAVTSSLLRVHATPSTPSSVTGSFQIGSGTPGSAGNVITNLPVGGSTPNPPVVPVRQQYLEFTLHGVAGDVQLGDLRLYANGRLISLRGTRLFKVSDVGTAATYRLLGIDRVSSASARYTFMVGGVGGGLATSWLRR